MKQAHSIVVPLPLPVQPPSRHVYNVTPSPPLQRHPHYHLEKVAGKAPLPAQFKSDMKNQERWILQIDDYFTMTQIRNEQQQLAYVGLCTKEEALESWKTNRHRYTT